ncbi:MAG TPA: hypothetical protein VJT31_35790 [Rugosimonospora sp.]|nr:hypothetical protein [Rugosimonospora sp.]
MDGTPALAALLACPRELPRRALTATLLDLAARGYVELSTEDGAAWVRAARAPDERLGVPERLVLAHVARHCAGGPVPLSACCVNGADATAGLWRAFSQAVGAEAVHSGLCARRLRGGYRLTRLGRQQAPRAATATVPAALEVFHEPDRDAVWSRATGTWRRLAVREDHTEGWRETSLAVVARALAVCVAAPFAGLLAYGTTDPVRLGSLRLSWVLAPLVAAGTAAGSGYMFRDTWRLARDFLRRPVVETADVVYTEHVASTGEYSAAYHYVGLDSGAGEVVTLWDVPPRMFRRVAPGVRVELRRTPVRSGLRSMTPVR